MRDHCVSCGVHATRSRVALAVEQCRPTGAHRARQHISKDKAGADRVVLALRQSPAAVRRKAIRGHAQYWPCALNWRASRNAGRAPSRLYGRRATSPAAVASWTTGKRRSSTSARPGPTRGAAVNTCDQARPALTSRRNIPVPANAHTHALRQDRAKSSEICIRPDPDPETARCKTSLATSPPAASPPRPCLHHGVGRNGFAEGAGSAVGLGGLGVSLGYQRARGARRNTNEGRPPCRRYVRG